MRSLMFKQYDELLGSSAYVALTWLHFEWKIFLARGLTKGYIYAIGKKN